MNRDELRPEWQLALMGSVDMDESMGQKFEDLLEDKLEWGELIFQLVTHRALNMFYYNLQKFKLTGKLEKELQRLMDTQWQVFYERNTCYLQELGTILREFEKVNLIVPIIKGNLLASKIYPCIETRIFNDLDLLMRMDDVDPLTEALTGIGFVQGHYDQEKQIIVEATRKEKILQLVASHEMQEFQKITNNRFAKLVQVDVNHDILWKGNCPYKVNTNELIERAIPIEIGSEKGYMLDYIDNIIQLSSHLYKEATLMMWVTDMRDLKIYKFADIFMYIKKFMDKIDWNLFIKRIKEYNIKKVVYYSFHYIEMMFGELVPEFVINSIKPSDLSYLNEYGIENKEPSRWEWDFFTRLFDTNRVLGMAESQYSNLTRFIDAKMKSGGSIYHRNVQGS